MAGMAMAVWYGLLLLLSSSAGSQVLCAHVQSALYATYVRHTLCVLDSCAWSKSASCASQVCGCPNTEWLDGDPSLDMRYRQLTHEILMLLVECYRAGLAMLLRDNHLASHGAALLLFLCSEAAPPDVFSRVSLGPHVCCSKGSQFCWRCGLQTCSKCGLHEQVQEPLRMCA
eukprot:GHUV01012506.1.p1 GENE.GHUV01012506.1~~GHUV01012506.1.p1  ORF type:complete len:172 (-),score=12.93 GHUV01012506.1:2032-2547(-)